MPMKGNTEKNVTGQPFWPYFLLKGQAWFFFIFGTLALLGTFAQINPIWLYGPYTPLAITMFSQPDCYMGFLEGALRIWLSWTWHVAGHTLALNVLIPGLLIFGLLITAGGLYPFFERWVTGDKREHHLC